MAVGNPSRAKQVCNMQLGLIVPMILARVASPPGTAFFASGPCGDGSACDLTCIFTDARARFQSAPTRQHNPVLPATDSGLVFAPARLQQQRRRRRRRRSVSVHNDHERNRMHSRWANTCINDASINDDVANPTAAGPT
jgi:hypothetical protein